MVVAVALSKSNELEPVVKELVIAGEVLKTATPPVPVSSDSESDKAAEAPVETKLEEPSVKTALEAVRPEKLIVPDEVMPVAPVITPNAEISIVGVFKKLVKPEPPELVIKMASVTTVVPPAVVSALSKRSNAATALSSVSAVNWFWIWKAYSVFPETEGLLVKLTPTPVKPLVLAVVDWAKVTSNRFWVVAVFAAGVEVPVKLESLPVVNAVFVKAKVLPVVVPGTKR